MVGGEGVAVADFTNDGKLDIFVPTIDRDLFFVQQLDGSFVESDEIAFPGRGPSITMGASSIDYDGDQDMDLFVLNVDTAHQLYENKGDGTFEDIILGMKSEPYRANINEVGTRKSFRRQRSDNLALTTNETEPL